MIAVNDVFIELDRNSQLLETGSQTREPTKDHLYDELKRMSFVISP